MCRWLGVADAVLRGPEKGGKSSGVVENMLTDEARAHPWFGRLSRELPDRRHFRVLDSRLYDLIPHGPIAAGLIALSHEALGHDGPETAALTGLEVARASGGVMPRMLGVNHHPEIVNRPRQLTNLKKRRERGAVTDEWYKRACPRAERDDRRSPRRVLAQPDVELPVPRPAAVPSVSADSPSAPRRSAARSTSTRLGFRWWRRARECRCSEVVVPEFAPAAVKPPVSHAVLESIDVRVGTIQAIDDVPGSRKLVKLTVGFGDHTRTILAGLRQERPDLSVLIGRQALFVVNLEPRQMAGVVSEGMLVRHRLRQSTVAGAGRARGPVPDGVRAG